MRRNIITILLFSILIIMVNINWADDINAPNDDVLKNIYTQLQNADGTDHPLQDITYSLTYGNAIPPGGQDLFLYPGKRVWGISAHSVPAYGFDTSDNHNKDFGLPYCNSESDCLPNSVCYHSTAFTNAQGVSANTKMCTGAADENLAGIYNLITRANKFVDITTLEPFPNLRFKATIRDALTTLAKTGKPITVRILDGLYLLPVYKKNISANQEYKKLNEETESYLEDLVRDVKNIQNEQLTIYIAGMRSCSGIPLTTCVKEAPSHYMEPSWNHSKIVNVDGKIVMTGGVNWFATNYLETDPVFDLMNEVWGPAAQKTLGFTNMLWTYVRNNMSQYPQDIIEYGYKNKQISKDLTPPNLTADVPPEMGVVEVLGVGRTGGGILSNGQRKNASDLAIYLLLSQAQHTIYLAQQSLEASFNTWPFNVEKDQSGHPIAHTNFISALARLLEKGGDVYIVTSPYSEIPVELGYSSLASKSDMWNKIKSELASLPSIKKRKLSQQALENMLVNHLHIANIRFNNTDSHWPDGKEIYDHYKFIMTDEHLFYFGSQNFYPSGLQNYGYIINDNNSGAAEYMLNQFWEPLWNYSKENEYKPDEPK